VPDQDLDVQLRYDGTWNDAPAFTEYNPITWTRGRGPEQSGVVPCTLQVELDNRTLEFSPQNPTGSLFGKVGPYTAIRARVDGSTRVTAEVDTWDPDRTQDFSESPARGRSWTTLDAAGVMRRLSVGSTPLRSPLYREITKASTAADMTAYWPVEDGTGSTTIAAGSPNTPPGRWRNEIQLAEYAGIPGSEPLPVLGATTELIFSTGAAGVAGEFYSRMVWSFPAFSSSHALINYYFRGGTVYRCMVLYDHASNGIDLQLWSDTGSLATSGAVAVGVRSTRKLVSVELVQDGADIDWLLFTQDILSDGTAPTSATTLTTGTFAGQTLGAASGAAVPSNNTGAAFGHLAIGSAQSFAFDMDQALIGYLGEAAGVRAERLCTEFGVPFIDIAGDLSDSMAMGVQPLATRQELLDEIERSDGGIWFDPMSTISGPAGLTYITGRNLYNMGTALTLTYEEIVPPLRPQVTGQAVRNDVTVRNRTGATARAVLTSGPLSTADAPDGIGTADTSIDVNLASDEELQNLAQWWLHRFTFGGYRWPEIRVADLASDPTLIAVAASVDIGEIIELSGLPADITPNAVRLLVTQVTETVTAKGRVIGFTCLEAGVFNIGVLDDADLGQLGSDGSTVASDFDAGTDTALSVAVAAGYPGWTDPGVDFDIEAGGVRLTCTAVAGAASPYTLTVNATPVNGVVKTIPAGSIVDLWHDSYIGV
jgi:hypothetical protein